MKLSGHLIVYSIYLFLTFLTIGFSDAWTDSLTSSSNLYEKINSNYIIIAVRLYGTTAVFSPIISILNMQFMSVRIQIIFSTLIGLLGSLVLGLRPPVVGFTFGMIILGLGVNMVRFTSLAILSQYSSSMIGILFGFSAIGLTVVPFILKLLGHDSWNMFFWILMSLFGLITIFQFFLFRNFILAGSKGDSLSLSQKWKNVSVDGGMWKKTMSLTLSQLVSESLVLLYIKLIM